MLTHEELLRKLTYNPATGKFKKRIHNRGRSFYRTAGSTNSRGYVIIGISGKSYRASRLAWFYMTGEWPLLEIDHINNIRDDNRWKNLRDVSHKDNQSNRIDRKECSDEVIREELGV